MSIIRMTILSLLAAMTAVHAQSSLLDLVDEGPATPTLVSASFKTTRIINLHSIEQVGAGTWDLKIGHRFGFLSGGIYELFGLDQASIRIGMDYGVTDRFMIGAGRSSFEKTYDGFAKYSLLRQSSGRGGMPISLAYLGTAAVETLRSTSGEISGSSRWHYTHQLLLGRKFSELFTLQLSPGVVHRNQVNTSDEANDVWNIPIGGRIRLNRRITLNAEYVILLNDPLDEQFTPSLSLGFDIETGGHVFQLHFSNSTSMIEKGFITETVGRWGDGDIHFGFNVSRVF